MNTEIIELSEDRYSKEVIESILNNISASHVLYAIHAGIVGVENIPDKFRHIVHHQVSFDNALIAAPTITYKNGLKVQPTSYEICVYNVYRELVLVIRLKSHYGGDTVSTENRI